MPRFALRGPRGFLALTVSVAATAAVVMAQAPAVQTSKTDNQIVKYVAKLLEHDHLAKPTINDEISKRWVKNYIKSLDSKKYFFLKADVDEFHKFDTNLDETLETGDLTFAKLVMDRFQERAEERFNQAMDLLKQKPDFTLDEVYVEPDQLEYPATADEAKDRLRKEIKLRLLGKKINKVEDEEAVKQTIIEFKDSRRAIRQFDNSDLLGRYLTALTMAVDPHSSYMDAKDFEDMLDQSLHLSLIGIGAELSTIDGFPTVQNVVPGGAADKDGRLQPEDKILGIVLDDGTRESFVEKKLSDVVRKIRGKLNTKVRLIVQPSDSKEEKIYELIRQNVALESRKAKGQVLETKAAEGEKPHKIGVIHVPTFYGDIQAVNRGDKDAVSVTRDCRKILEDFKKQGVEGVIIDVRSDPGGLLLEAITLSGLFIDQGPIVQVREEKGIKQLFDEDEGTAWDGPLAVVIDHFSASASEIFAGAIKDYGRGLVVGDSSTYGKGSVQSLMPLNDIFRIRTPNIGALKLTIQQFYLPDGDSTQIRGVTPHLHIPSVNDVVALGEAKQDSALKFDKVAPLSHDKYKRVNSTLLAQLREKSEARRKASAKFQEEEKYISKVTESKKRHEITLNEKKFREEIRADDKADEAKSKAKGKGKKGPRKPDVIWDSEYYNDEVLAIVNDYLTLGSKNAAADPIKAANAAERPPQRP